MSNLRRKADRSDVNPEMKEKSLCD